MLLTVHRMAMPRPIGKPILRSGIVFGTALSVLVAGLALTNPSRAAYERYATRRLSNYLSQNVCADLPAGLGSLLQQQCNQILEANQGTFQAMIQRQTQVQNYILFSLYHTQLAVPNLEGLPTYRVATVGLFNQFFTYKVIEEPARP